MKTQAVDQQQPQPYLSTLQGSPIEGKVTYQGHPTILHKKVETTTNKLNCKEPTVTTIIILIPVCGS